MNSLMKIAVLSIIIIILRGYLLSFMLNVLNQTSKYLADDNTILMLSDDNPILMLADDNPILMLADDNHILMLAELFPHIHGYLFIFANTEIYVI